MPAKKLSEAEVTTLLSKTKGWNLVNGKLHREFACKDFVSAFGSMTRVALVAEAMNHHPEWSNVWNKVVIDLNTHSVKGISDYDFVLAEKSTKSSSHFRRWAFLAAEKVSDLFGVRSVPIENDLRKMSADPQPQNPAGAGFFL